MTQQIRIPDRPVLELSRPQATAREKIELVPVASVLTAQCLYTSAPSLTTYFKSLALAIVILALVA
jgi:hypothetical protein